MKLVLLIKKLFKKKNSAFIFHFPLSGEDTTKSIAEREKFFVSLEKKYKFKRKHLDYKVDYELGKVYFIVTDFIDLRLKALLYEFYAFVLKKEVSIFKDYKVKKIVLDNKEIYKLTINGY